MAYSTPALDTLNKEAGDKQVVKVRTVHPLREPFRPVGKCATKRDRKGFLCFLRDNPLAYAALITLSLIVACALLAASSSGVASCSGKYLRF